jgi:hypothetical protein
MESILDDYKREQIIGILSVGGSRVLAANYVGCHPRTIYNAAKANPDFAIRINRAESDPEYHLLSAVTDAGKKGVAHAAKWALERLYPDTYGRRKPGSYSVDAIKELLMELATRLSNAAASEEERVRSLKTMAEFGKEMILATEPFVEEAIPLAKEINALREYFRDVPAGDESGASPGSATDLDPGQTTSNEDLDSTQIAPALGSARDPKGCLAERTVDAAYGRQSASQSAREQYANQNGRRQDREAQHSAEREDVFVDVDPLVENGEQFVRVDPIAATRGEYRKALGAEHRQEADRCQNSQQAPDSSREIVDRE